MTGMASRLGNPQAAAACSGDRASRKPTGWRTDAGLDEGDGACSMADGGASGSDVETEPPPKLGSVLNPDAVHETMSLFGGTESAKQNARVRSRMHRSSKGTQIMVRAVLSAQVRAPSFADAKHLKACLSSMMTSLICPPSAHCLSRRRQDLDGPRDGS